MFGGTPESPVQPPPQPPHKSLSISEQSISVDKVVDVPSMDVDMPPSSMFGGMDVQPSSPVKIEEVSEAVSPAVVETSGFGFMDDNSPSADNDTDVPSAFGFLGGDTAATDDMCIRDMGTMDMGMDMGCMGYVFFINFKLFVCT